ncbi:multiple sugar transport system substrate-binding protein [Angulomicrobium tetraedrale]|uniref:Multiple sugar transport system substrate-binding protein n=1 Tax=Ancylobacter tetraedralis TaxID=217068 RepID=A0A839Z7E4_9HYPH|nr:extracellular solute-binding protein [Ancylobacter tetraedralis]MBB3769985.1 multiple sugar transport system substrate-binding protein [Ancylobacter tetraedralis]
MSVLLSRRDMLLAACAAGAAASLPFDTARASEALSVFGPLPPDPAPPGAAKFAEAAFEAWKKAHNAQVSYDLLAWPQLHDRMATAFASGSAPWNVLYMCGWVPEFAAFLAPFADDLPKALVDDLPASSFETVTWQGKRYGAVFTLSLLTLFYNKEHLAEIGFSAAPKNWDEFKRAAKELTRAGRYGFVANYGDPAGIGGTASYWMAFLQQAGGKMYGEDGLPVFKGDAGVAALQMMMDLMPGSDPGSISYAGINDATNVLMAGRASMMMNWPFMWNAAQDPAQSQIVGKLGSAILPAGPAGSASIDGTDAWTVSKTSADPALARQLVEFYLDADVQKRQALDTGWLPIRLSVLADPEVQQKLPNAAVVLEQAKHPYNSFVTPDFNQVTQALGTEVQKALQGQKTAAQAIADASDLVTAIVKRRG